MEEELRKGSFRSYYDENRSQHGTGAKGVGYRDELAQAIRFKQLVKLFNHEQAQSDNDLLIEVNDLGCGDGGMLRYLRKNDYQKFRYYGWDILPEMIETALKVNEINEEVHFSIIENAQEMNNADYTVASGVFNLKGDIADDQWMEYILRNLQIMDEKSNKGFAFNILTKYSDKERMQQELYYADPGFLFDYCKTHFSRNVALLHDYDEYDFTILVRK